MARTLAVLREYRTMMDRHGVVRARAAATSAARDAGNAEEFLAAAHAVLGVRPELLSGDEEGRLSFAGATAHLPPERVGPGPVLVVDIGGGSTELVAGEGPGVAAAPDVVAVSLDIGCVRVSERFLVHDPPLARELADARAAVDAELARARAVLPALAPGGLLVGLAGTVSTLAALDRGVSAYERALLHHVVLGRDDVERWLGLLSGEDSRALARPAGHGRGPGRRHRRRGAHPGRRARGFRPARVPGVGGRHPRRARRRLGGPWAVGCGGAVGWPRRRQAQRGDG